MDLFNINWEYCKPNPHLSRRAKTSRKHPLKHFSTSSTKKFLEIYEQYPCLWDHTNLFYKNKTARDLAYNKIARQMDIDGFDMQSVKDKIKVIRSVYELELGKIHKSRRPGTSSASSSGPYEPKIAWFDTADRFLRGTVKKTDNLHSFDGLKSLGNGITHEPHTTMGSLSDLTDSSSMRVQLPTNKTGSSATDDSFHQPPAKASKEDDEFDLFGKSIVMHLRKLPLNVSLECQSFIQTYLIQQRLKCCPSISISKPVSTPDRNNLSSIPQSSTPKDKTNQEDLPVEPEFNTESEVVEPVIEAIPSPKQPEGEPDFLCENEVNVGNYSAVEGEMDTSIGNIEEVVEEVEVNGYEEGVYEDLDVGSDANKDEYDATTDDEF